MVSNAAEPTRWPRLALIAAGTVWLIRAVIRLYAPDYWSPRPPFDYAAVVDTSLLAILQITLGLLGLRARYLDMKAMLLRDLPEITRHGPQGVVWNMRVLTGPWGFGPADLKMKTHLWQGDEDVNVPPNMGPYQAHSIPNCRARFIPMEGHLTYVNRWPEIVSFWVE